MTFKAQFMIKLSSTEAESEKIVVYKKKGVVDQSLTIEIYWN